MLRDPRWRSFVRRWLGPVARRMPEGVREALRRRWYATAPAPAMPGPVAHEPEAAPVVDDYARRLAAERAIFDPQVNVHDLPQIYHYWSNTYLRPMFEAHGFSYPEDFFAHWIAIARERAGRPIRVVSIGCGNADSEVRVAQLLRERGVGDVTIECLDLNPVMLDRGRDLARNASLEDRFEFVVADFNRWQPTRAYDVVMANQSLHHVLNLEGLFDAIAAALGDDGLFLTSDIIGRNGHQRWPEALAIVHEFWRELPRERRYNLQLRRHEELFLNWDCSVEGFEGIRAQDILPLLVARFGFELFLPYANVIDPFIDRSFGHHFDADSAADRALIDRIHARDEAEMLAGRIKPTHVLAVMRNDRGVATAHRAPLTPAFCVRPTAEAAVAVAGA